MKILILILGILLKDGAFLTQSTQRDSVLVGDRLFYGFTMEEVPDSVRLGLPEVKPDMGGGILALPLWKLDTLKIQKIKGSNERLLDLKASLAIQPFEEGSFVLPPLQAFVPHSDGSIDTLVFKPCSLEVKAMPIDTATFVPHDIKGQETYPVTFAEVLPWILGAILLGLLIFGIVKFIASRRRKAEEAAHKDPPHIVALRKLDGYRGEKFWAPEKQKIFYSGVTDTLREYIAARYGFGAMEMTTAEIFEDLGKTDVPADLYTELKDLFVLSDFVKFAKHSASDQENAGVLPLAVRFVTTTYQAEVEEEAKQ